MKNLTVKVSGLAIAMLLALPAISMAQSMGQTSGMGSGMSTPPNQQTQQAPPQDSKPAAPATPAAPVLDPKEEAAFKNVSAMQMSKPEDVAKAGEGFAKMYPKSNHLETIYSILAAAYMQMGDDTNMFKYGRMTLQMNKDNIDALAVMSVATARKIDPDNRADALQKEKSVEDWSARCISTLQALVKPDNVTDADFARSRDGKLAMCYSGLGQTDLFEGKNADAVKVLSTATKLEGTTPDPVDLYLLGMAYQANRQFSDAVTVFQQCVKDTDQRMVPICTDQLNNAKKEAAKAGK
jgi:tetratricopeptide (TPR) repeat protein